jgi:hypothetical protein
VPFLPLAGNSCQLIPKRLDADFAVGYQLHLVANAKVGISYIVSVSIVYNFCNYQISQAYK